MQTAEFAYAFNCPACLKRYDESDHAPKSLACGHSCCLECAKELFESPETKVENEFILVGRPKLVDSSKPTAAVTVRVNYISCPTCRKSTQNSPTSLTTNYGILGLMAVASANPTPPIVVHECSMCEKTEMIAVVMHCGKCNLFLCQTHSGKHQDDNKDHVLQPTLTDMCPIHPAMNLEYYCDCSKLICATCFVEDHGTHNLLVIQDAFDNSKSLIESSIFRSDVVCDEMNAIVDQLKDLERGLSVKEAVAVQSIETMRQELKDCIDHRCDELISSLSSKRLAVESQRHAIESQSNQLSSCSQSANVHLDYDDKINCLSIADPLITALSNLDDDTKSDDLREIKYDSHLEFVYDTADVMLSINQIGQLDVSNAILKAKQLEECRIAVEEMKQDMTGVIHEMGRNMEGLNWETVDARLAYIASNHLNRLPDIQIKLNQSDDLMMTFKLDLDGFVSERRSCLKRTWDGLWPSRNELESRRVVIDILKQTRGALNWNGPDSVGNQFNWNEELSVGEWDGIAPCSNNQKRIQVDKNGMITKLFLNKLGMQGLFPDSIGFFVSLTKLSVSDNQLTDLPESMSKLTYLAELSVHTNQLTRLPDCIHSLTCLSKLYVRSIPVTFTQQGKNEVKRRFERTGLSIYVE